MSRHFAVFGHPVAHSLSPKIHAAFGKQTGIAIDYRAIDVEPGHFTHALNDFVAQGGAGANVTLPFKQAAFSLCDDLTERARRAGAVNTLVRNGDTWHGDNTDGVGLVRDLTDRHALDLRARRTLLLGAGGAARGVLGPLLEADPEYLEIANRNAERAAELAREYSTLGTVHGCGFDGIAESTFDLVLNATSASLQDTIPPIPPSVIAPTTLCYDMAYGKGDTAFTRWCKSAGAGRTETGWGMLVEQAAESFLLWRGVKPETAPVIAAVKR